MPPTDYVKNRRTMIEIQPEEVLHEEPEMNEQIADESPKTTKLRRAPGTSDQVTMKLNQHLYGPLKTIASLLGKSSGELLNELVKKGLEEYKSLTINDLITK